MDHRILTLNAQCISEPYLTDHRFSDSAKLLFDHVRSRASLRSLYGLVNPLIILWSMLRWEPKVGTHILEYCGADLWSLEKNVDSALNAMSLSDDMVAIRRQSQEGVFFDFRDVGETATVAVEEARRYEDTFVSTEHITLALGMSSDTIVQALLKGHGIEYENMKSGLDHVRGI